MISFHMPILTHCCLQAPQKICQGRKLKQFSNKKLLGSLLLTISEYFPLKITMLSISNKEIKEKHEQNLFSSHYMDFHDIEKFLYPLRAFYSKIQRSFLTKFHKRKPPS